MDESVYKKRTKTIVLVLLFLTWIVNYLDKNSMNIAIVAISKEFHLNPTQSGMVISSFFLAYAIMQLIGGWLTDKHGSRKVILASLLVWSFFTIFTGFAWSFASLLVIRFLFGIGEGSFPSASSVALAETFPKEERARAKGVLTSATAIGAIVASLLAALMIQHVGWNVMFYLFGVLGFLFCILLWKYLLPPGQTEKPARPKVSMKKVLKNPLAWKLMLIYFGISMVNWGLSSWMPSYWMNVRHIELVKTGMISVIPVIFSLIAINCSSWLMDKIGAGKEKFIIVIGSILGIISLFLMMNATSVTLAVTFLCLANFGMGMTAIVLAMPLKYFSQDSMGSTVGIMYFGGQMAGTIAPTLLGYMITLFNGSYDAAFTVLIIALVIPIITCFFLTLKNNEKDEGTKAA